MSASHEAAARVPPPPLLAPPPAYRRAASLHSCPLTTITAGLYPTRGDMREPQVPLECPLEVAQLMAACLQEDPTARPTARQIVELLTQLQ